MRARRLHCLFEEHRRRGVCREARRVGALEISLSASWPTIAGGDMAKACWQADVVWRSGIVEMACRRVMLSVSVACARNATVINQSSDRRKVVLSARGGLYTAAKSVKSNIDCCEQPAVFSKSSLSAHPVKCSLLFKPAAYSHRRAALGDAHSMKGDPSSLARRHYSDPEVDSH